MMLVVQIDSVDLRPWHSGDVSIISRISSLNMSTRRPPMTGSGWAVPRLALDSTVSRFCKRCTRPSTVSRIKSAGIYIAGSALLIIFAYASEPDISQMEFSDSNTIILGCLSARRGTTTDRSSQVETAVFSLSRYSLRNLANFGEITIWQYGAFLFLR